MYDTIAATASAFRAMCVYDFHTEKITNLHLFRSFVLFFLILQNEGTS